MRLTSIARGILTTMELGALFLIWRELRRMRGGFPEAAREIARSRPGATVYERGASLMNTCGLTWPNGGRRSRLDDGMTKAERYRARNKEKLAAKARERRAKK
jgi:hypothetical protein